MKGKGKIYRIDDWDKPEAVKCKSWSHQERLCDLKEKVSLHKKGDIYYISQFTRSKTGTSFSEIKQSEELASFFAERACEFLHRFIVGGCEGVVYSHHTATETLRGLSFCNLYLHENSWGGENTIL